MSNVPHPYVGWDAGYGLQRLEEDLAYFQRGGGDDTYDVLLLGSSVAAGFGEAIRQGLTEEDLAKAQRVLATVKANVEKVRADTQKDPDAEAG